jgi:single-strand DNA-binding protein
MDNVVVGNLCQDPILRQARRGGLPVAKFTVAVNSWRRVGGEFVERPPVFHRVVCFGQLAENVTNTLRKGMEVVAVGEWADDSFSDEQGQRRVQITMEARTVGPTLRWATAQVNRSERRPDTDQSPPLGLEIPVGSTSTESVPAVRPRAEPDLTPVGVPVETLTTDQLRVAMAEIGAEFVPAATIKQSLRRKRKPEPEPATSHAT